MYPRGMCSIYYSIGNYSILCEYHTTYTTSIRNIFMQYTIAVYRSRSVSTRVYQYLISQGVSCSLVSTPRAAQVGCGISVRLSRADIANHPQLSTADTFAGFFEVVSIGGKTIVSRI